MSGTLIADDVAELLQHVEHTDPVRRRIVLAEGLARISDARRRGVIEDVEALALSWEIELMMDGIA